jgi:hypothetical protein
MAWGTKEADNNYQRNRRQRKIEAGECARCSSPARPGKTLCDKHAGAAHKWYKADYDLNPEKFTERTRRNSQILKLEVIGHYGGKCACCGELHIEFLVIDHVNGEASFHKSQTGKSHSGARLYHFLKREGYPEGYRVLCASCNTSLAIYGYCPHGNLPPQITNHPANPYRKQWKQQYLKKGEVDA